MSAKPPFDLVIVGGGMVGASLALALRNTTRRVALIEPAVPGVGAQPSFDDRTSALSNGTRRILETIGVWQVAGPQATPIRRILVSDAGHLGATRLDASELGMAALGYTLPNRVLGSALWQGLRQQTRVEVMAPATVTRIDVADDRASVQVRHGDGREQALDCALVVAADGAQSLVRTAAGIAASTVDYQQVAIVANLRTSRAADGSAYERFTPHGPLAVLPLADGSFTVVWTVARDAAPSLMGAADHEFLGLLQQRLGWRIGSLARIGARSSYPLALSRAERSTAHRTALVGNAAQSLHPVAGQGFNLGLRDAAVLAEAVATAADAGAPAVLDGYEAARAADRRGMIHFTDGLVRTFAIEKPGAAELRSLGMVLFDMLPPAKQALSRISWGFGGRAPRLLRGLPLT